MTVLPFPTQAVELEGQALTAGAVLAKFLVVAAPLIESGEWRNMPGLQRLPEIFDHMRNRLEALLSGVEAIEDLAISLIPECEDGEAMEFIAQNDDETVEAVMRVTL